jgi:hypothetical protein
MSFRALAALLIPKELLDLGLSTPPPRDCFLAVQGHAG